MASAVLSNVEQFTQLAGHNRVAMLTFRLGGPQTFGINVFKVREVLRRPKLEHMPSMHALLAGSFDYRGQTIPVLDLAAAMSYPPLAEAADAHVLVTEFCMTMQAFLVADVDRIVHCDGAAMSAPATGLGFGARVNAVTRVDGALLAIIDVEQILAEIDRRPVEVSPRLQQAAGTHSPRKRRILVVDDSAVARLQLTDIVRQLQCECVTARDGAEGLEKLREQAAGREEPFDLVISDIEMPRLDGYALVRAIRETPELRRMRVLLHSSLSGVFNEAMVARVGADRFVAKFQPDVLANSILELMPAAD